VNPTRSIRDSDLVRFSLPPQATAGGLTMGHIPSSEKWKYPRQCPPRHRRFETLFTISSDNSFTHLHGNTSNFLELILLYVEPNKELF
jgi:hypothetical protein